jgi:hypothetical protein
MWNNWIRGCWLMSLQCRGAYRLRFGRAEVIKAIPCESVGMARFLILVAICWLFSCSTFVLAQASAIDPEKLTADERLKIFVDSVSEYRLIIKGDEKPLTLRSEPLIRFDNQVGGVVDGVVMVWTKGSRPVVAAQVFVTRDGYWIHEFQSFAEGPLALTVNDRVIWSPQVGGGQMNPIADGPSGAKQRAARTLAFKEIANQFVVTEDFREKPQADVQKYELRLLSAPLYRYEDKSDGVDGAVFAFVHGTDPELLLTLEGLTTATETSWSYSLAPLTCWGVRARRNEQDVFASPEMIGRSTRNDPYHVWVFKPDFDRLKVKSEGE